MKPTNPLLSILLVLATLFLPSCSNPKKDYEPVQQLQTASVQSIQSTSDDAAKLKSCDDVIKALDEFMKNHPDGEWNATAKTAMGTWQSRRGSIQETINGKLDFESIQKLQDAAEQVIQHSADYIVRARSCDDIISSLQTYVSRHPEGDRSRSAATALMSWESRKATLEQELGSLSNRLYSQMKERARTAAMKKHAMSKIDDIHLDKRTKMLTGDNIQVTAVYGVRMRGALLGSHIFKLKVTTTGGIDPAAKQVFVDDKVSVEE